MDLAELLLQRKERIFSVWAGAVRGSLHPEAMPRPELIDHLPIFVSEMAAALRTRTSPEQSPTAADHGAQRLNLGFNLDSVVREYGALRDAIVVVAQEEQVAISADDLQVLFDCTITGIAAAVSEYARERDAELRRQTNEHFGFLAHELRNPLGSAMMALEVLRQSEKLPEERATLVLQRGLTRMQELIESTLRGAQVASGITVHRERVKLRGVLEDAELSAAAAAEAKSVGMSLRVPDDLELFVDPRLLSSAVTNLVSNAVKFTHPGGAIEVRATGDDSRVTIEVEDACGGLPPGAVEKAFAPFAQLGTDRSGFGLGLAIAKQAVDAHGGSLRIQNLPGKGCIFVLELPVAANAGG